MIICEDHKLLFVQVPQTGSSAIGAELCELYGGRSVLTKHAGVEHAVRRLPLDIAAYTVVSGVRNPLDQAVSSFFKTLNDQAPMAPAQRRRWLGSTSGQRSAWLSGHQDVDFSDFFLRFHKWPHSPRWLASQRRSHVVIRFERIQEGFSSALELVGVSPQRPLPLLNKTQRPGSDFVSHYSRPAQARALTIFAGFMKEWGYEFPAGWVRGPDDHLRLRAGQMAYRAASGTKRVRRTARGLRKQLRRAGPNDATSAIP